MSLAKLTARSLAVPAFLMGIAGAVNIMYLPLRFFVAGDAAATASNIAANELLYRLCVFSGLVSAIAFLVLALGLYELFGDVDRRQARLLVALVGISAAITVVNLLNDSAPLILLSGADNLSAFTRSELEALAQGFLRLRAYGININSAFWGLWLLPYGGLVWKSGFVPRFVGVFLIVGGMAYVLMSVTAIVFPAYQATLSRFALPLYAIGEVPILAWLLIRGGRVPLAGPRSVVTTAKACPLSVETW